jgi:hypothetical protein
MVYTRSLVTMSMTTPLDHEALLTLARKLEGAAADGEVDRVHYAARRLLGALVDHIRAERDTIERLSPETARGIATGQQRLVFDLAALAVVVQQGDLGLGEELVQALIADLTVQADDERRRGFADAIP